MPAVKNEPWFAKHGVISIGAQAGGPERRDLGRIKVDLVRLLRTHCSGTHCLDIDHYALALRIGGKISDWSPEQIHRIRRDRKQRLIGCDIDIPIAVWTGRTTNEMRDYLAQRVFSAMELLASRLQKDREEISPTELLAEVSMATEELKGIDYEALA